MTDMEMNILSRLAMLKTSGNVNGRFTEAQSRLKKNSRAWKAAEAIRNGDKENKIALSLLEWAEYELGSLEPQC